MKIEEALDYSPMFLTQKTFCFGFASYVVQLQMGDRFLGKMTHFEALSFSANKRTLKMIWPIRSILVYYLSAVSSCN